MVRLKVCPCFRLSEYDEFMESVANRPWDAWHVVNDGKRFIINYVSDGFYRCYLRNWCETPSESNHRIKVFLRGMAGSAADLRAPGWGRGLGP